jgi:hypothetical protein
MDIRSVVVHKADGTNVTAGPDAVKETTAPIARDAPVYTDYKEKHITVPSLRPGDTLEYSIATQIVKAFAPNQFWFEHNFLEGTIVLDEQLELNIPKGRAINLQSPEFRFEKADSATERLIAGSAQSLRVLRSMRRKKPTKPARSHRTCAPQPLKTGKRSLAGTPNWKKAAPNRHRKSEQKLRS